MLGYVEYDNVIKQNLKNPLLSLAFADPVTYVKFIFRKQKDMEVYCYYPSENNWLYKIKFFVGGSKEKMAFKY